MIRKALVFTMLLFMSSSTMAAQLWTLDGLCDGGVCDGSFYAPGTPVQFNVYLDDAALVPTSNPLDLLAFQAILNPGEITQSESIFTNPAIFSFDPFGGYLFLEGPLGFFDQQPFIWSAYDGSTGAVFTGLTSGDWSYQGNAPVPQVPVPAAVWLFGSGLIGLIGVARRKA